jgi:hypothetical protein
LLSEDNLRAATRDLAQRVKKTDVGRLLEAVGAADPLPECGAPAVF